MYIPYGRQSINDDDIQAVLEVLKSDFLTTGPKIEEFEKKVADYTGAKYAVAIANGTAALHAACFAAGISDGDEVITTPITFAASANCAFYCGARPVFADIDPDTYNIDPADIERKITDRTKALIPVHYSGQPCDMDRIGAIAKKHGLIVIEDAAHALGASYKGRKIGSISDMTTFSFHPVKHITTGEGGMILTNDEKLYERLKLFRTHGITREEAYLQHGLEWKNGQSDRTYGVQENGAFCGKAEQKGQSLGRNTERRRDPADYAGPWYYEQVDLGYNYRITDIQCALGISQMNRLDAFVERRRKLVERYNEAFCSNPDLVIPKQLAGAESSWHLYVLQVLHHSRREVFEKLRSAGIGVNVHYIPVYTFPYYQQNGYQDVFCEHAEELYRHIISLPLYPDLTEEQQDIVIETVRSILENTLLSDM